MLLAIPALAQPSRFADDFEGRGDLVDGGPWEGVSVVEGTIALSAAAAHRGDAGLRIVDTTGAAGLNNGTYLFRNSLGSLPPASWLRFWFRPTSITQAGEVNLALVGNRFAGQQQGLYFTGPAASIGGFDEVGFTYTPNYAVDAGWQLVEFAYEGAGTMLGSRELFLDGRSVVRQGGALDFTWTSAPTQQLSFGFAYVNDARFVGVVDFDDVRLSDVPPASRLIPQMPDASVVVGSCIVLSLALVDSRGALVSSGAPSNGEVTLSLSSLTGTVHADGACGGNNRLQLTEGAVGPWPVSVRVALAGTGALMVAADDLLSSSLPIVANGDAGVADAGAGDGGLGDGGTADAGAGDGGLGDGGTADAGAVDGGLSDAGLSDAGLSDAGLSDAGLGDAGLSDAGPSDAGLSDAGLSDGGLSDGGLSDAGIGPLHLAVGCGCGTSPGALWGVALALLWMRRASPRRTGRSGW